MLFGSPPMDPSRSFAGHRFYVGFEAVGGFIDRLTSLFFQFEFVPLNTDRGLDAGRSSRGSTTRRSSARAIRNFYFTGGVTLKF